MNLEDLTLQAVTTVAGAVLVIELVLELFVKPAMENLSVDYQIKWGRLTCNVAAFVIGLAATLGAGHLVGLTSVADVGQLVLVSLAASSMATAGYEVATNAAHAVRQTRQRS
jgi:hypothetical protein